MPQTILPSFFTSRKRPASEDIITSNSKLQKLRFDRNLEPGQEAVRKKVTSKKIEIGQAANRTVKKVEEGNNNDIAKNMSTTEHFEKPIETAAFVKKSNVNNIIKTAGTTKTTTTITARKDLNLGEVKKIIKDSPRFAELKASAERLSKNAQRLKEVTEKRNLKEFKYFDVEVPISPSKKTLLQDDLQKKEEEPAPLQRPLMSPRKVVVSPIKSPSKISAYMKQDTLAFTSSNYLCLPFQYRRLVELFNGMETVVGLLSNRNEQITFAKLKSSVQEMLKKNFTEKHLAQIKHLVPDYYNFELKKIKNFDTSCHKDAYELVVSPNFPHDIKGMNPTVFNERRRYFYDTLLKLVKKHHAEFLLTLLSPMVIPDDELTKWHPNFEIDKVPDVECARLPVIPNSEKIATAQDVLAKARELLKCNTKMGRALEKLAQAKARGLTEQEKAVTGMTDNKKTAATQTSQSSASTVTLINPALRNLPASILEKVKAKQAAKALEAMTRSSDREQKYTIYSRLPDLAKTMRNIFVTERKNVLALNIILSKLDSSFKSNVSASDLQRDIKVLAEQVPDWIKIHEIRNTLYLKLDKNTDMNNIISKLQALSNKYRNE